MEKRYSRRYWRGRSTPPIVTQRIADELWQPYLGGHAIVSRTQMNARYVELMNEYAGQDSMDHLMPFRIPQYRTGMSRDALSHIAMQQDPQIGNFAKNLFMPRTGPAVHHAQRFEHITKVPGSSLILRHDPACANRQ